MCDLLRVSTEEKIEGYKLVAKKLKGKRYFSLAMGFKYPRDGHIPIVKKQRRISSGFKSDIISERSVAYRRDMIGRTAIYIHRAAAREDYYYVKERVMEKGYEVVMVRAEITGDIMEGLYAGCKVTAGRHIRFMGEVD